MSWHLLRRVFHLQNLHGTGLGINLTDKDG